MNTDDQRRLAPRRNPAKQRWREIYATSVAVIPLTQLGLGRPPYTQTPIQEECQQLRTLRLVLRAAAVAALGEAEWVRRVRASGVALTRVQTPDGHVTRYLAQTRDPHTSTYGAKFLDVDLGTDLLLSELRTTWAEDCFGLAEAVVEWRQPWARFGRESVPVRDAALWARALGDAGAFTHSLTQLPALDRDGWAWAAGRVAGMLAIWSLRAECEPAVFAAASEDLAASAARRGGRRRPQIGGRAAPDLGRAAYLLTQIRADAHDEVCEQMLLRQLVDAASCVAVAHHARGAGARARLVHTNVVLALSKRLYPRPQLVASDRGREAR